MKSWPFKFLPDFISIIHQHIYLNQNINLVSICYHKWKKSVYLELYLFILPQGMRDLSSPTSNLTHTPWSGSGVLTTRLPGKSPNCNWSWLRTLSSSAHLLLGINYFNCRIFFSIAEFLKAQSGPQRCRSVQICKENFSNALKLLTRACPWRFSYHPKRKCSISMFILELLFCWIQKKIAICFYTFFSPKSFSVWVRVKWLNS